MSLDAQFRCGGSEAYVDWVQRLLGLAGDGPVPWECRRAVCAGCCRDADGIGVAIVRLPRLGYGARMTAGFCWRWSDPTSDGALGARRRNRILAPALESEERTWSARSTAVCPVGIQAGRLRAGRLRLHRAGLRVRLERRHHRSRPGVAHRSLGQPQRKQNKDPDFRSASAVSDAEFDRLVRHVYKVLMTRGMVGTLLYSTDEETRELLRSLIP